VSDVEFVIRICSDGEPVIKRIKSDATDMSQSVEQAAARASLLLLGSKLK
jgi:hypothetical protein